MTFEPLGVLSRLCERHRIAYRPELLPESRRLERSDGPGLHYLRWGGSGPVVVLLHGGALTAHTWDLVCMALGPAYRCVALDLRGHGESDWADSYRIDDGVGDLLALLEHLDARRVHLVGMSLGGNIAGHAAALLGARAASLTMVDIAPGVNRDGTSVMRGFLATAEAHESVDALVEAAKRVSPRSDPETLAYRYHYMTKQTSDGWSFRGDRSRRPDFPHIMARLEEIGGLSSRIACPLLIAVGARSRVLSIEAAERFAARFCDGRAVTIADAGHNVQEDNPRALADALRAHLETAEPR